MESAFVFLDAGYLSKISKHLGKGKYLKYDLNQFANTLAKEENLWCEKVFYYTAPPYQSPKSTEGEDARKRNYDKFIAKLRKIPNFIIKEGRLQKIDNEFAQKGVDTLLTMDLTNLSNSPIKTILLLACDTDFVPILKELREKYHIKIILAYFSDFKRKSQFSMSNHILTQCDKKLLIKEEHFEKSKLKE